MEELEGVVVFLPFGAGSKSESLKPFLYIDRDTKVRIWVKDDNPFENRLLSSFDGKYVIIKGNFNKEVFEIAEMNTKVNGGADNA